MKPLITVLLANAVALQASLTALLADGENAQAATAAPTPEPAKEAPKAAKAAKEKPAPAATPATAEGYVLTAEDIKTACGLIAKTECAKRIKAWVKAKLGQDTITAVKATDYPALLDAIIKSAAKDNIVVPDPRNAQAAAEKEEAPAAADADDLL